MDLCSVSDEMALHNRSNFLYVKKENNLQSTTCVLSTFVRVYRTYKKLGSQQKKIDL